MIADPIRLAQVISNLINNAARYTPRAAATSRSRAASDGDMAYVRVADDGIGIPPELQATIFEMFVQERVAPMARAGSASASRCRSA